MEIQEAGGKPRTHNSGVSGKEIITKVNILSRIKDTSETAGNEVRVRKTTKKFVDMGERN